ncbi:uncharacterized protein YcbK (DUF882 family) [Limimaricola soesokkakensis]|uniref:Murein endopeptidase K n=1 Tax=Limimaricola soesokkakensis TaxID=1343159 RepID=A0A1X6ZA44_9RHOB|nr:DUF882 domain-containing protein [Limimaricola soesokkakensis]PSK86495.1 uncharacterized protein YcbK (DUF882 family) [Limimaricola soesokkakensis]SLN44955.1 Peptidase M15 [Limimaricola soesokkakensis]
MNTVSPPAGRVTRRKLVCALGAGLATPLLSGCAARGYEKLPPPTRSGSRLDFVFPKGDSYLDISNAHTGERTALRFMKNGRTDRRALQRLDWLFRDWRDGEAPSIDPRIYWGLAALSDAVRRQGHSGQITLLSGFRTPQTTRLLQSRGGGAASNSYHMRRRAADIQFAGIPTEEVANIAEWLQVGGVGRYHGSDFTHIDSGPIRTWRG